MFNKEFKHLYPSHDFQMYKEIEGMIQLFQITKSKLSNNVQSCLSCTNSNKIYWFTLSDRWMLVKSVYMLNEIETAIQENNSYIIYHAYQWHNTVFFIFITEYWIYEKEYLNFSTRIYSNITKFSPRYSVYSTFEYSNIFDFTKLK